MLAYERHGSGETLILVHGITHRRQAWYPVLERLAAERDVILVDLPGHGESPPLVTNGRPVEDVLREQFKTFIADIGVERPHVAGNSLGGMIALIAGAEGDARSVTALSPAGFWRTPAQFAYTRRIFLDAAAVSKRMGKRTELLARSRAGRTIMYGLLTLHPSYVSRDQALGDARAFAYARPALRELLDAAEPFHREIAPDIPVTIAWADHDRVLPPKQATRAREVVPQAQHVMMHHVGHVPMTDDPQQVAEVILRGSAGAAQVTSLASMRPLDAPSPEAADRPRRAASA